VSPALPDRRRIAGSDCLARRHFHALNNAGGFVAAVYSLNVAAQMVKMKMTILPEDRI
jgi:hypothetical protein